MGSIMENWPEILRTQEKLKGIELIERLGAKFACDVEPVVSRKEIKRALQILSEVVLVLDELSEREREEVRRVGIELSTKITSLYPDEGWAAVSDILLTRLGNFPSRRLLRDRFGVHTASVGIELEKIIRDHSNTVSVCSSDHLLTDFQFSLFSELSHGSNVSVSAPTSAGKSYALMLEVVREISQTKGVIVYIVPTRALIRQVVIDISRVLRLRGLQEALVLAAPVPVEDKQARQGVVYVLTQERLHGLLFSDEPKPPKIATLIIDEAQELGDSGRGMLLHSTINLAKNTNPGMRFVFSSPRTENPAFALDEFSLKGAPVIERVSPVSKMIVILDEVKGKTRRICVSYVSQNAAVKRLGILQTSFKFRVKVKRLAHVALLISRDGETSIIYCNERIEAEKVCQQLYLLCDEDEEDEEILELIEFINEEIHEDYSLIRYLKRRIAYHYGDMPHLVRAKVEDLVRAGKIRFVCCTSTLLQGVNLPVKNILIEHPKKGRGRPMQPVDFWNLIGRAGRLGKNFTGNVWCLCVGKWEVDTISDASYATMRSAFSEAIVRGESYQKIREFAGDTSLPSGDKDYLIAEQVLAKVHAEYILASKNPREEIVLGEEFVERVKFLAQEVSKLPAESKLTPSVFQKNSTVSPWHMNALNAHFDRAKGFIEALIPSDPRRGGLDCFRRIFGVLDEVFFKSGNRSYFYYASLAHHWVRGSTLKKLIEDRIEYKGVKGDLKKINDEISKLLRELEKVLRYKYVKYLRVYNDVLVDWLDRNGKKEFLTRVAPLYLYVEFGASDKKLVRLMSLGISRATSLHLLNLVRFTDDAPRSEVLSQIRKAVERKRIPRLCENELVVLFGLKRVGS